MIPPLLLLAGAALSAAPVAVQDTVPFADAATRRLVEQAMARHRGQDSVVRDYIARINYRLSVSLGRRKWAMPPIAAVEEQAGRIQWQHPNNLRVDIDGTRFKARNPSWRMESTFDSPWFVPRGLGDSVRVFGNDFPEVAAIHPLSAEGPSYYRYAAGDTLSISTGSSTLRVASITVTPSRPAPSLVTGRLWVDLASAEVVRFTFKYVGTDLWAVPEGPTAKDTAEAKTANKWANRILSIDADLEYALQENRYWMPYRHVLSGRVQIPIISDIVIPFDATTTFEDYEINTGKAVVFHLPPPDTTRDRLTREERRARMDTLRQERSGRSPDSLAARERGGAMPGGGRFEIRRPPRDSLRSYAGWEDSLRLNRSAQDEAQLRETQADMARMAEQLDRQITGYQTAGVALERLSDIYRNNRVQGQSLGFGYAVRLPPDFTSVYGSARYGLADGRFLARVALIRDAPEGKVTVAGYRDMMDADVPGRDLGDAARKAADRHRAAAVRRRTVAELAVGVVAPAGECARVAQRAEDADGHVVVADEDGGRARRQPQQAPHRLVARALGEVARDLQLGAGLEARLGRHLVAIGEYKLTRTRPEVAVTSGSASTRLLSHHVIAGLGWRF